jgi:pyridoxine kinase
MVLPLEAIEDVIKGIEEREVLAQCDGVLSGYMGDVSLGITILDAVAKVRKANPGAAYCCDPVMGDVGRGFFVRPGIPEFMKTHAVPAATIVTPNQFELEYLANVKVTDLDTALQAVDAIMRMGPSVVLVTSLHWDDRAENCIELLAVDANEARKVETPLLPLNVNGAGDMTAALFFVHWLRTKSIQEALEITVSAVFGVLEVTAQTGSREIKLVEAQDCIANPERRFSAERVR